MIKEKILNSLNNFKNKISVLVEEGKIESQSYLFNLDAINDELKDIKGKSYPEEEIGYRLVYQIRDEVSFLMRAGYHFFMNENELYIAYDKRYRTSEWHKVAKEITFIGLTKKNNKIELKDVEWNKIKWNEIKDIQYFPNEYFSFILYSNYEDIIVKSRPPHSANQKNIMLHTLLLEILDIWKEYSVEKEYNELKSRLIDFNKSRDYYGALNFIEQNKKILCSFDFSYPYFYQRILASIFSDKKEETLVEYRNFKSLKEQIDEKGEKLSLQLNVYNYYLSEIEILINEMFHNYYETALTYYRFRDIKNKVHPDENIEIDKKIRENYKNYIKKFKELPLRERNIITFSDTDMLFKSEHITLLNINQQLPEIHFPQHHPKVNQTYIAHPYKIDSYLPIENYDYELLNDRLNEFFYILQCLGATSITFETIEEENNEEKNHSNLKAEAEAKTKIAGGKVGVEYDSLMNSSLRNYLKIERTQTFDPEKRPYIPKDVVWFPNEFSWQRLAQQRLNGNFLSHDEILSSSQTQTLDRNEILDVNAELKMLFTSVKAGVHYQEEKEIKQNRAFSCRISVKFKPMNEFPEETEIIDITAEKVIQTPIQLPAPNDNEARYLEEIHFMLEDDGVIDDRERTILERFRTRYNITPERAKELEAQAIASAQLTPAEQEYLEEYKNSLQNGEISERERRLLNRLATALGIDEARVAELEQIF